MAGVKGRTNNPNGRPKGALNKSTQEARQAIAAFVDNNAHRLQKWLDEIADGVRDEDGELITSPNPEKAFQLFQSVIEYHVPKLARTEMSATVDAKIEHMANQSDLEILKNWKEGKL